MTIKIKLLHPNARMPEYKTAGASGMDLVALDYGVVSSGDTVRIRLGIALELPEGYEAQIRPRSSISKRGIVCHLGTVDSDYRGELAAVLTATPGSWLDIAPGDRIAQLVIAPVARVEVVQVDELSETVRGGGGFGHTGR